jgi:hypothetical protein
MGDQAVQKLRPAPRNKTTTQAHTNIHTTSGIRTHDPSIRAVNQYVLERPEPVTGTEQHVTQRLPESTVCEVAETERETKQDKR